MLNRPTKSMEAQEEAGEPRGPEELLAEGKKCLAAGDAGGAVENLQEACALLAAVHGQVAKELAEPYYLYGRALLEVAREETAVLGSGIPVPEESPSSEEDEDAMEEEDAADEKNGSPPAGDSESASAKEGGGSGSSSAGATSGSAPGPGVMASGDAPAPSGMASGDAPGSSGMASGDAPGPSGLNEVGQAEEEEESDLKLAWEMLELARLICQRQEGDEFKLKLADVNMALGEVGLESDQNEQAISDIEAGLGILREVLEPTDRRLAEAFFNLGLACSLSKQYEQSAEQYKSAKEVIEKRMDKLQKELEEKSESDRKTMEDEIQELKALLPDLESKIMDAQDMTKVLEERKEEEGESSTSFGFGNQSSSGNPEVQTIGVKRKAAVNDISHLVRKRPAEEASGDDEKKAKRVCTEESKSNGGESAGTTTSETTQAVPEQ